MAEKPTISDDYNELGTSNISSSKIEQGLKLTAKQQILMNQEDMRVNQ